MHIYLSESNAEELLPNVVELMKNKVAQESRVKAFEDCTQYWKEQVTIILRENSPSMAKVSRIRQMFGIEYEGDE
jgi:hypothetical protein